MNQLLKKKIKKNNLKLYKKNLIMKLILQIYLKIINKKRKLMSKILHYYMDNYNPQMD